MRIKTTLKYQINDYMKTLIIYYLSIIGITIFFGIIPVFF